MSQHRIPNCLYLLQHAEPEELQLQRLQQLVKLKLPPANDVMDPILNVIRSVYGYGQRAFEKINKSYLQYSFPSYSIQHWDIVDVATEYYCCFHSIVPLNRHDVFAFVPFDFDSVFLQIRRRHHRKCFVLNP